MKLGVELGGVALRDYYVATQNPVQPAEESRQLLYTDDCTSLDLLNQAYNHNVGSVLIREFSPEVILY